MYEAQIKVSKCWGALEISYHMPDCGDAVCAELGLCSHFIITIIILDASVPTRAISR